MARFAQGCKRHLPQTRSTSLYENAAKSLTVMEYETPSTAPPPIQLSISNEKITVEFAHPLDQPDQVHQLTEKLYEPYEVENGTVSLAGCLLEDIPFVRIEQTAADGSTEVRFVDQQGHEVSTTLQKDLGFDSIESSESPPSYIRPSDIHRWLDPLASILAAHAKSTASKITRVTLIWCKRAIGKMQIEIGNESAMLPFTEWAIQLARGTVKPPRFHCEESGKDSYHIVALDDGTLTVADAVQVCGASGNRALENQLVRCEETDTLCLPGHLVSCEATGNRIMESARTVCSRCGQKVGRSQIEKRLCVTCRALDQAIPFDAARIDPTRPAVEESKSSNPLARLFQRKSKEAEAENRSDSTASTSDKRSLILSGTDASAAALADLQQLVKDNPGLKKWKQWRIAESDTRFVFRGENWMNGIELATDKQSSEIIYVHSLNRVARLRKKLDKREWTKRLAT